MTRRIPGVSYEYQGKEPILEDVRSISTSGGNSRSAIAFGSGGCCEVAAPVARAALLVDENFNRDLSTVMFANHVVGGR